MAGHIQLGKYADTTLRHYALEDVQRLQAATANPYAARVSTGGPYASLDTFNDWTIQDWHAGVGNRDPENGQWFSIGETRYPNYLMLPPRWTFPLSSWMQWSNGASSTAPTEIAALSSTKFSVSFTAAKTGNAQDFWVLLHLPYGKECELALHSDNGSGKPGSVINTASTLSFQTRAHAHWIRISLDSAASLTSGTRYHIVIQTDVAAELSSGISPYLPAAEVNGGELCHYSTNSGSTWNLYNTTGTVGFQYFFVYNYTDPGVIKGIYVNGSDTFLWVDNTICRIAAGALTTEVSGITIYDVKQAGDILYIAYGTGYKRYNMTSDATTDVPAVTSYMFLLYGGYLWRSNGNTVAYTSDEVTWITLSDFTDHTSNDITGMAGMGNYVYCATKYGLWVVADGDQVVQTVPWPEVSTSNGVGMVSWENALYIPMKGGTLLRYSADGALLNVGINAKEELPIDIQGSVVHLCPTNYFLMAAVESTYSDYYSSLWAYNVDGWHCLGLAPAGQRNGVVCVDRENEYLYWGLDAVVLNRTVLPADINNPARSQNYLELAPEAWVEYDRFYGGYNTLDKDFDRIYIDTENPGRNVHVYWMDESKYGEFPDDHNGEVGWQYLGVIADGDSYIQWPATGRPTGKSLKIALRLTLRDADGSEPPVVRGVAVKYSTNVADRFRWVLPIPVSDNQQMPDGTLNPYTAAQQAAHIKELIRETAPLRFVDVDGEEYTVKVTGASRNIMRYDWLTPEGEPSIQYLYTLTIEQVS